MAAPTRTEHKQKPRLRIQLAALRKYNLDHLPQIVSASSGKSSASEHSSIHTDLTATFQGLTPPRARSARKNRALPPPPGLKKSPARSTFRLSRPFIQPLVIEPTETKEEEPDQPSPIYDKGRLLGPFFQPDLFGIDEESPVELDDKGVEYPATMVADVGKEPLCLTSTIVEDHLNDPALDTPGPPSFTSSITSLGFDEDFISSSMFHTHDRAGEVMPTANTAFHNSITAVCNNDARHSVRASITASSVYSDCTVQDWCSDGSSRPSMSTGSTLSTHSSTDSKHMTLPIWMAVSLPSTPNQVTIPSPVSLESMIAMTDEIEQELEQLIAGQCRGPTDWLDTIDDEGNRPGLVTVNFAGATDLDRAKLPDVLESIRDLRARLRTSTLVTSARLCIDGPGL